MQPRISAAPKGRRSDRGGSSRSGAGCLGGSELPVIRGRGGGRAASQTASRAWLALTQQQSEQAAEGCAQGGPGAQLTHTAA